MSRDFQGETSQGACDGERGLIQPALFKDFWCSPQRVVRFILIQFHSWHLRKLQMFQQSVLFNLFEPHKKMIHFPDTDWEMFSTHQCLNLYEPMNHHKIMAISRDTIGTTIKSMAISGDFPGVSMLGSNTEKDLPGFGVAPGTWSASTRGGPGRSFERFPLGLRRCRYHETETANQKHISWIQLPFLKILDITYENLKNWWEFAIFLRFWRIFKNKTRCLSRRGHACCW